MASAQLLPSGIPKLALISSGTGSRSRAEYSALIRWWIFGLPPGFPDCPGLN
jgi:hypothetical protein